MCCLSCVGSFPVCRLQASRESLGDKLLEVGRIEEEGVAGNRQEKETQRGKKDLHNSQRTIVIVEMSRKE